MRNVVRQAAVALCVASALASVAVTPAEAQKPVRASARRSVHARAFSLFAGSHVAQLEANRVYCGLTELGELCTDVTGSPILGGASWPRGTPDQYVFNSGIQVGAIIPAAPAFDWAGDTVGAWAIDTRGPATHTQSVTGIWNSLVPDDVAQWPASAYLTDPAYYHPALIGSKTASRQDTWVRYWDADPTQVYGRNHPMGLLVEQRTLAFDHAGGPEDIIFVVFRLTNISARTASVYDGLAAEGRSAEDIAAIAALGAEFQRLSEAELDVQLPDGGWPLTQAFVAFTADMDVGDAGNNYATAALPFRLGVIWKSDWLEPAWQFPRSIFTEPFAVAPGLVAAKLLRTPFSAATGREADLSTWTTYTGPSGPGLLPEPLNIFQGYRYFAHTNGPATGDASCQYPPSRIICFASSAPSDQRFMQSAGPFDLAPGHSAEYAIAYLFAAALRTNPGFPAFDLGPYIGNNGLPPGVPARGDRLLLGLDTLRLIDAVMGWQGHSDADGDGFVEEDEVTVVPGSLLDKARVAQSIFDNGFLMPAAPESPEFHIIPGDGRITVVWGMSPTETVADPYFAAASDPTSGIYDPNYRANDVEGYRVWRGTSPSSLELVAQFDYAGTAMQDWTGTFVNGDYRNASGAYLCAPELGITSSCPAFPNAVALADGGPGFAVEQVAPGGRLPLRNTAGVVTDVMITRSDTAVSGGGSGYPALRDTGVPFVYEDIDVRNGYRYYYAVTAFDVNSFVSGPSSQSSPLVAKSVVPRVTATNAELATLSYGVYGDDTVRLDTVMPAFTLDAATGRFSGPPSPTGASQLAATFLPLVPELLPRATLEFRVDSVRTRSDEDFACAPVSGFGGSGSNIQGLCGQLYYTFMGPDTVASVVQIPLPVWEGFAGDLPPLTVPVGTYAIALDSSSTVRYGMSPDLFRFQMAATARFDRYIRYSAHENQLARRILGAGVTANMYSPGGSRWFDGANETLDHPTIGIRAGHVAGVDTIFHPLSHMDADPYTTGVQQLQPPTMLQCFNYAMAMWGRQADIEVTWGAGGTIASVRDVTNHVDVPFKQVPQGSYGFVGDANGNGMIDWNDFDRLEGVLQSNVHLTFCMDNVDPGPGSRALLVPNPVIMATSTGGALSPAGFPPTGNGFGLYIAGHRFIFQRTGGAFVNPAAGTKWTLRSYAGVVTATNPGSATPTAYQYADARVSGGQTVVFGSPIPGTPAIPGLRVVFRTTATAYPDSAAPPLAAVHTVPDPLYVTHMPADPAAVPELRFVNLPDRAILRIYSTSGILVALLVHNDPTGGGELTWDVRSRNGDPVASGVYFYHVETPSGATRVGRFTVVTNGQ